MKRVFPGLVFFLSVAAPALAASLVVWPPDATTQDSLVLEVQAVPPCTAIAPDGVQLLEGGVVRVYYDDGSRTLCSRPNLCPLRIPLGRLPAGYYSVEFVPDRLSLQNGVALPFTVFAAADAAGVYNVPARHMSHRQRGVPIECRDNPTLEIR